MLEINAFQCLLEDRKSALNMMEGKSDLYRIMRFFSEFRYTHLERKEHNKQYYQALGWMSEENFDVVNSFWIIFKCALIECVNTDKRFLKYKKHYRFTDTGIPLVPGGKYTHKVVTAKREVEVLGFPDRYITYKQDTSLIQVVIAATEKYIALDTLARLCHCCANFMPCPGTQFNSLKGLHSDTVDFLPLTINLIEHCCSENKNVEYTDNGKTVIIENKTLIEWKKWLIDNRETYCLEDYYDIVNDDCDPMQKRLKGNPFFKGQDLARPFPKNETEVHACLGEMLARIEKRAHRLYDRYIATLR